LYKLTVTKTNLFGYPASDNEVFIFGDPGIPRWVDSLVTDGNGKVSLYVAEGNYHIHSIGYKYSLGEKEALILTAAENVSVTGDTNVTLDERDTVSVSFDPNKPRQTIVREFITLRMMSVFTHIFDWGEPKKTVTYVSPVHVHKVIFNYEYYPEGQSQPADSLEWHNVIYAPDEIIQNTTFVVDYSKLVRRTTDYKTALESEEAWRYELACHPNLGGVAIAGIYGLKTPQRMILWLSPEPAFYRGAYAQRNPESHWFIDGKWIYESGEASYLPGSNPYFAYGEHPLTSNFHLDLAEESLRWRTMISEDAFGSAFSSGMRSKAGNMTVLENGVQVYRKEISDWLDGSIAFSGTPAFTVIIEAANPTRLSTETLTELTFSADLMRDHQPPRVRMKLPNSNMLCSVPRGEMLVNVTATDDTVVSSLKLEFSLDDGARWGRATETGSMGDSHRFSLSVLGEGNYVSLRVNATDPSGNSISQTTIRGFYVAPWGDVAATDLCVLKTAIGQGYSLGVDVTVENQGDQPETVNVTLQGTRQLPPRVVNLTLFASESRGWGFTPRGMDTPGPLISVNQGDAVNLTLVGVDGLTYNFFVDYNKDGLPSAGEPKSPDFSETITYQFTVASIGSFAYYCEYYMLEMHGTFTVRPRLTATVEIDKRQVPLDGGASAVVQFSWNTTGFVRTAYTLSAVVSPVRGETDVVDNTFVGCTVFVGIVGDIGGVSGLPDGKVDIVDVALASRAFGTYPGHVRWNANADVNGDGRVDIEDLARVVKNFGRFDQ
jgi:hypothetical protein